jgi:hypothetical protein
LPDGACGVRRLWRRRLVVPDVLSARRIEMVDAAGEPRASLSVLADGRPVLVLADETGKPRAGLEGGSNGSPDLSLFDTAGRIRTILDVLPDGSPSLVLADETGKSWAALTLHHDGSSILILSDAEGDTRAALGATFEVVRAGEDRTWPAASLVLFDKDGKVIWKAP